MKLRRRFNLALLSVGITGLVTNVGLSQSASQEHTNGVERNASSASGSDRVTATSSQDRVESPANAAEPTTVREVQLELPPALADIIRKMQAGEDEDAIIQRIKEHKDEYGVTPRQLVYLRDLGVPAPIITALLDTHPLGGERARELAELDDLTNDKDLGRDTNSVPRASEGYASPPPPPAYTQNNNYYGYGGAYADFGYFYPQLAPYGTWCHYPGYGWGWQPMVCRLHQNWKPYWSGGHWVWTDVGWYWKSGYSWGWAPFHYGRWWKSPRHGWTWFPGRQWAPAWVSWCKTRQYVGWAPLSPGTVFDPARGWKWHGKSVGPHYGFGLTRNDFSFVPYAQMLQRLATSPNAPATLVKPQLFDPSMIYTDLVVGPNQVIVNRGVEPRLVEFATGRSLKPVPLREVLEYPGHAGRGYASYPLQPTGRPTGSIAQPSAGSQTRLPAAPNLPPSPNLGAPANLPPAPSLPPAPTLPPAPGSSPYGGNVPQHGPMSAYRHYGPGYVSPRGWTPPGFSPQAPSAFSAPLAPSAAPALPARSYGAPTLPPMAARAAPPAAAGAGAPAAGGGGGGGGGGTGR